MPIHFSAERWERIRHNARLWWQGKLGRPLLQLTDGGADPGRPEPRLPGLGFHSGYGLSTPVSEIVDRWDYDLSRVRFRGDAFPAIWPNFGAGVLAAFLGAELHNAPDTVWFHPKVEQELADVPMQFDPDNPWFRHVLALTRAAVERWDGQVQVGLTDLGGSLDVLSTFRPSEALLYDLYDVPEVVKQRTWDVHTLWWQYFELFSQVMQPLNPGYTAWTPIFSEAPYYMLQCDFCYMIGPEMFDEFVKPELAACCRRLTHAFYHLDGPGQLPHLESLLTIPELKGVQWVPGQGNPDVSHWPEVYRKIRGAGKLIQVYTHQYEGGMKIIDVLAEQLGSAEGIVVIGDSWPYGEDEVLALLAKYGA